MGSFPICSSFFFVFKAPFLHKFIFVIINIYFVFWCFICSWWEQAKSCPRNKWKLWGELLDSGFECDSRRADCLTFVGGRLGDYYLFLGVKILWNNSLIKLALYQTKLHLAHLQYPCKTSFLIILEKSHASSNFHNTYSPTKVQWLYTP